MQYDLLLFDILIDRVKIHTDCALKNYMREPVVSIVGSSTLMNIQALSPACKRYQAGYPSKAYRRVLMVMNPSGSCKGSYFADEVGRPQKIACNIQAPF